MREIFLTVSAGVIFASLGEWLIHRYALHWLGEKKTSFFHFHRKHHRGGYDAAYKKLFSFSREACSLLFLLALYIPLARRFPIFAGTLCVYTVTYYFVHRYAHLNPRWGERWIPWHFDHHMGSRQDKNWGILLPLWDYVLRTREPRQKYFR